MKKVNSLDSQIILIVLDKQNKYKINYNNDYNLLYDLIASELAKEIRITEPTSIIIDKCKPKDKFVKSFNKRFLNSLDNPKNHLLKISHENSVNQKGLQVIDVIVWSAFQNLERDNKEFISLIKNKSVKRIFED